MANLYRSWSRLTRLPGGARLFSALAGWFAPYAGTLGARVEAIEPGFARIRLPDRRRVRNHLDSVHAMALANLCEMTAVLAVLAALPDAGNMIPTHFAIDFLKKGRGALVATCAVGALDPAREGDLVCPVEVRDPGGAIVATARVTCRLRRARARVAA